MACLGRCAAGAAGGSPSWSRGPRTINLVIVIVCVLSIGISLLGFVCFIGVSVFRANGKYSMQQMHRVGPLVQAVVDEGQVLDVACGLATQRGVVGKVKAQVADKGMASSSRNLAGMQVWSNAVHSYQDRALAPRFGNGRWARVPEV